MWELISANKRNSVILMAAMAICLLALGAAIGAAFGDALIGVIAATAVWIVMTIVSYVGGDQILLSASRATPVTKSVHPQLFNVVEEMTIAAGLNKMPAIYIINDLAPNAFATGRNPNNASIAVTAGLLSSLNRDELQGVVAHEMSHVIHRDILYVTLAGVMLGAIVMIAEIYLRSIWRGSSLRRRTSGRGGGGGEGIFVIVAIILAILAPFMAQLLYFALSRSREYMADAGGARLTRYPEGLASALEKIATSPTQLESANKATAPMYIVNPFLQAAGSSMSLFSTHPPTRERIAILRSMMHGAAWKDYTAAYSSVTKKTLDAPASLMKDSQSVAIRDAPPGAAAPVTDRQNIRQAADIMRTVSGFAFLTCPSCGLKMKVPPGLKGKMFSCPRCNTTATVSA